MTHKFRLNQCFVSALILAALPAIAHAAAVARVDFSIGDVVSTEPSGTTRSLPKGSQISAGELINTNSGRAQLRFTDGAFMSLQPRTEFRVDNYKFDGKNDGSERGFFSLLSGGIRVITGLVGRGNSENYQLNTATGVLGVRGTEYSVSYGNSIIVTVGAGAIQFCNAGGCTLGTSGQTLYIADANTKPTIVDTKTDLPPAPFPQSQQSFMTTEDLAPGGGLAALTLPQSAPQGPLLQPGTQSLNLAFAHNDNALQTPPQQPSGDSHGAVPTLVNLDSSLRMNAFEDTTGPSGQVTWGGAYDAVPGGSGNDGTIAWNRWVAPGVTGPPGGGGVHSNLPMADQDALHYVVGALTPKADMDALRIANVTATYDLLGATRPTSRLLDQSTVGVLTAARLVVRFGPVPQVDATFAVLLPAILTSYSVVATNLPISNTAPSFGGLGSVTECLTTCTASISGFFPGPNAARAALVYSIEDFRDPDGRRQTAGAAAFTRRNP